MQNLTTLNFAIPQEELNPKEPWLLNPCLLNSDSILGDSNEGVTYIDLMSAVQPLPGVLSFRLFLAESENYWNDEAWTDSEGHTILLLQPDNNDRSKDRLFVNSIEIEPGNWRWDAHHVIIRWSQGRGDEYLAGELAFDEIKHRGVGSIMIGNRQMGAIALSAPARFSCRLMNNNKVAYKTSDGTLKWIKNKDWDNSTLWSSEALLWSFWVEEYVDPYTGKRAYRPRIRFNDQQTENSWEPAPGTYTAFIDSERQYMFEYRTMFGPIPKDNRSNLKEKIDREIKTVFPKRIIFKLDASAQTIEGVMEVDTGNTTVATEVYAVKGKIFNPMLVGIYNQEKEKEVIEKSADSLINNSAKNIAEEELTPYYLYNLDPYEMVEVGQTKTIRDVVQNEAEKSLSNIIQYYIPLELRKKFISVAPIDLDPQVRAIAESKGPNGEDPKQFYNSISIPFLTLALSRQSAKLNARRARRLFDERLSKSPVYNEHIRKLYVYHFTKKFEAVKRYLADEYKDVAEKKRQIEYYTQRKRNEYEGLKAKAESKEVREQYDLLIKNLEEAKEKAFQGRYWAHRVYTYFTGDEFVEMIKMQLFGSPDGAKAAIRNLQRVSTILSVLDSSQYFANQYADFMRIFQLYAIIAQYADLKNDEKSLNDVAKKIVEKFADEHINSQDEITKVLSEYIKRAEEDKAKGQANLWNEIFQVIYLVFSQVGRVQTVAELIAKVSSQFDKLIEKIEKFIKINQNIKDKISKIGPSVKTVVPKLIWFTLGVFSFAGLVVMLAMNWETLSPMARAGLIVIGAGMLANFALGILQAGLHFYAAFSVTGSLKGALRWSIGIEKLQFQQLEEALKVSLQSLLERLSRGRIKLNSWSQLSGIKGYASRVATRFVVNIARVVAIAIAAVMAIVNIIMSAISIFQSKTTLEAVANGLMLTASILELLGLFAEFVSVVLAEGTAVTIASVLSGLFAGAAFLLALAGIGIIIYMMVTSKPTSPVDEFVENEAAKEGLKITNGAAIEYLMPVYDNSGMLIKEGISISGLPTSGGNASTYLTITKDGVVGAGPLTHDQTTCFGMSTDGQGRALIFAASVADSGQITPRFLTVTETGEITTEDRQLAEKDSYRQLWCTEVVGGIKKENDNLIQAQFKMYIQNGVQKRYLAFDGSNFFLSDNAQVMVLSVESTKPSKPQMDDILLNTQDRDRVFPAYLGIPGCEPRRWEIAGTLPDFLTFDEKIGAVKQKEDALPREISSGPFTVSVKSGGYDPISSDPFRVEVTPAPAGF
ncbi:hypothetical protein [Desulfolucanica intricata]|uniref:hypothetical protein n=1 Tax=Desulfolucanica intricata TaxID=1285191 RepID=UPI0008371F25|nr:hypothetical protein [Desulfolucanica intricata]